MALSVPTDKTTKKGWQSLNKFVFFLYTLRFSVFTLSGFTVILIYELNFDPAKCGMLTNDFYNFRLFNSVNKASNELFEYIKLLTDMESVLLHRILGIP